MAKLMRATLAPFFCAILCSLCLASSAWADEAGPVDENGKWVPGTYECGTASIKDAHPGMLATVSTNIQQRPQGDTYYSYSVVTEWYASENGEDGWTSVSGGQVLTLALPDEGEAGYEDVVGHYLKSVVTYTYSMVPAYTSTGEFGYVALQVESDPVYVQPHHTDNLIWANDGTSHWFVCVVELDSQCTHRIKPSACQLGSESWFVSVDTHEKRCTTCGGTYGPEKHCFDDYIVTYVKDNPSILLESTVRPTCDICKNEVSMSTTYFIEKFVIPSGLVGSDELVGSKKDESSGDASQEESAPEANAVDASQVVIARTGDATPIPLLGVGILAAGALAFISRKRLAA